VGRAFTLVEKIDFFRAYMQDYKYKNFFYLLPDLHNRRLETSLIQKVFLRKKIQIRIEVIQRVVSLLKKYSKENFLPEVK